MGCADLCLVSDFDSGPEFHSERVVRAAKSHKCCECRDAIAVGERHEVVVGKWDGEFTTYRTCLACVEVRRAFSCGSWAYSALWEDVQDQMFPEWGRDLIDVECLARVKTPEADAKLRQRYAKWSSVRDG